MGPPGTGRRRIRPRGPPPVPVGRTRRDTKKSPTSRVIQAPGVRFLRGTGGRRTVSPMTANERSGWVRAALERFEGPLVAYATSLLRDAHAARDVVQDTFLRLVRADPATVDPYLARWLFTVCRHRAVDVLRRG